MLLHELDLCEIAEIHHHINDLPRKLSYIFLPVAALPNALRRTSMVYFKSPLFTHRVKEENDYYFLHVKNLYFRCFT